MALSDADYISHVDQLIGTLAQHHALGRDIDIAMCVCGLEPNRAENRKVRDFVVRTLKLSAKEFDRSLHCATIKAELGILPKTTRQFVEAFTTQKRITAQFNGTLRMDEVPYIVTDEGTRDYIAPNLWDSETFKTLIRTNFKRSIGFAELQQALRVKAAELHLDFTPTMINDATELWYNDICRNRLWQIMAEIDYNKSAEAAGQASLRHLVETCFSCPEGVAFAVAVFNKFIWQVKRKIQELPIYDHLMPVILGSQGVGKSSLVRKLLEPIVELWLMTDFKQMTDNRNISLWRNYVIFLDEMGWATKSDMDTVKNIITASHLTRRVMHTNVTQEITQNVTFIGTANATELAELIKDSSGTRRFLTLLMHDHPDWSVVNTIDWQQIWQSVDQTADDPMAAFRDLLRKRQESERCKTPIEEWIETVRLDCNRRYRSSDLHSHFREFEDQRFPGLLKTSLPLFVRELKRLAVRPDAKLCIYDDKGYIMWIWQG